MEKATEPKSATQLSSDDSSTAATKAIRRKSLWQKIFPILCLGHISDQPAEYVSDIKQSKADKPSHVEKVDHVAQVDSHKVIRMADKRSVLSTKKESSAMAPRICVIAKKGGVGKSTIVMALAGHLANAEQRVLVCDLDPQATASSNCLSKSIAHSLPGDRTVMALFHDECEPEPEQIIHQSHLKNIWVLPANDHFAPFLDPRPLEAPVTDQIAVADFLQEVEEHFDWILLDSTPALENLAAWNCLTAAHYAVSPVQMEGYSAQTVVGVEEAIAAALQHGNPDLKFLGYIVSEFDKTRKADHAQAEHALRARYNQQVFDTVIYRRAKLPQSQNADQHIYSYAPKSAESKMIDQLGEELIQRIEKSKVRRAA